MHSKVAFLKRVAKRAADMRPTEQLYERWLGHYLTEREEQAIKAIHLFREDYGDYEGYKSVNELATENRSFKKLMPVAIRLKLVVYTEKGYLMTEMGQSFYEEFFP